MIPWRDIASERTPSWAADWGPPIGADRRDAGREPEPRPTLSAPDPNGRVIDLTGVDDVPAHQPPNRLG